MKITKKFLALAMAALMLCTVFSFGSFASSDSKTVSILNYNVAGLPDFKYIIGKGGKDVDKNQAELGKLLNESGYDIIAVQEDFTFHKSLVSGMTDYKYKTVHSGGIPGGDGMNVYTKNIPVYNEKRTSWEKLYGVIDDGADELTPKGILYTCLDLGDGILVDFYDIHADAFGDPGSVAARKDNFRQLSQIINSKGTARPVIVTGDFNISLHHGLDNGLYEYLIQGCGFKDAWIELKNNGSYTDFSDYIRTHGASYEQYWGKWDSVEKFLYRDGDGVSVEALSFEYKSFLNSKDENISDHRASEGSFAFTKTENFKESTISLTVTKEKKLNSFLRKIIIILTDLFKIFGHWQEAKNYIGIG